MLIVALVALCGGLCAQGTKEKKKREKKPSDGSFWLDFNAGIGSNTRFDKSTVPFAYSGFLHQFQLGFTYDWKRCHIQFEATRNQSKYSLPQGTATNYVGDFEFLYSCLNPSVKRWHFWSGASVNGSFDVKQLPDMQNASTTVSLFHELSAVELVQCDFAYDKANAAHPWLTAFFQFSLPLYVYGSRPQFANVQHAVDMSHPVAAMFKTNGPVFKLFPGCSTDLGFMLNLRNGNRIGLSYAWDYLTTGKKDVYRYDNANHAVKLSFMFKL